MVRAGPGSARTRDRGKNGVGDGRNAEAEFFGVFSGVGRRGWGLCRIQSEH